jgi:hypothetical protein
MRWRGPPAGSATPCDVFSGALKKRLGLTIASAKEERGRVYRINGPASV